MSWDFPHGNHFSVWLGFSRWRVEDRSNSGMTSFRSGSEKTKGMLVPSTVKASGSLGLHACKVLNFEERWHHVSGSYSISTGATIKKWYLLWKRLILGGNSCKKHICPWDTIWGSWGTRPIIRCDVKSSPTETPWGSMLVPMVPRQGIWWEWGVRPSHGVEGWHWNWKFKDFVSINAHSGMLLIDKVE